MPIPKWRCVGPTDEGCHDYECLNCYSGWEGRTSPKDWKLCPYCGCAFVSEHVTKDCWARKRLGHGQLPKSRGRLKVNLFSVYELCYVSYDKSEHNVLELESGPGLTLREALCSAIYSLSSDLRHHDDLIKRRDFIVVYDPFGNSQRHCEIEFGWDRPLSADDENTIVSLWSTYKHKRVQLRKMYLDAEKKEREKREVAKITLGRYSAMTNTSSTDVVSYPPLTISSS